MNRRVQQNSPFIWTRLLPRYLKTIVTIVTGFILFNLIVYMLVKYVIYAPEITTTTESTTELTTITTTTTTESTTEAPSILGCFFDQTNITLADGSVRSLKSLTTADEVLVYSSNRKIEKSRILTVFHHQHASVRFLDIYTTNHVQPLRLTPTHSILTKKNSNKQSEFDYNFAKQISIGDWILSSKMYPVQVTNIQEIILYNQTISTPLTFEGNILANDLIASCYGTFSHSFMHTISTPLRYWYQIERSSQLNSFLIYFFDFSTKMIF